MRNILITVLVIALFCVFLGARGQKVPTHRNKADYVIYEVTAYCPCEKCCGRWSDGMTASGRPAKGRIAAAPPEVPFGTIIYIPGYGMAEVLDRGGSIKGRRLDVLFPTHEEALEWGVKYLKLEETW